MNNYVLLKQACELDLQRPAVTFLVLIELVLGIAKQITNTYSIVGIAKQITYTYSIVGIAKQITYTYSIVGS